MSHSLLRISVAAAGPVLAALLLTPWAPAQQTSGSASASSDADSVDLDVLMRGPVHEGFAEPSISAGAQTSGTLELPELPPEPINEQPASVRPADYDRDPVWLPGYWGVEEEDELCWVSGTWRYAPPGMRWVPGYWTESDAGATWVPGFWIEESVEQVSYLPPPPAPRETRRPARPGDNYFWVPGHHEWRDGQYVWHDGFWSEAQSSWVWVPARYVPTPRGYVYVDGYWDYPPDRRGTLFAPVRFTTIRSDYRYRPRVAINVGQALVHWFVRPNYGHYYFGNYYGDRYRNYGFRPWAAYAQDRDYYYYDPIYTYYGVTRQSYLRNLVNTRQQIVARGDIQLPVRYQEYQQVMAQGSAPAAFANMAASVDQLLAGEGEGRFENLEALEGDAAGEQLERLEQRVDSLRRFAQGRRDVEGERVRRGFRGDQPGEQPEQGQTAPGQDQPGDQPQDQPGDQPQDQPGDQPQDQPGDQPQDQPGDQPQDQPQDQPGDQPQDQPQDQPGDQPQDQPGDQPQDRSLDRLDGDLRDVPQRGDQPVEGDQPQRDGDLEGRLQQGDVLGDRQMRDRRDIGEPGRASRERALDMRRRGDEQSPGEVPQFDRRQQLLEGDRRGQLLEQQRNQQLQQQQRNQQLQQQQRSQQLLDQQQRGRAGAEAGMRGRFDLRPFNRGRASGQFEGRAGAEAGGDAQRQLQRRGNDAFAPPPRLRGPGARGGIERGGIERGGRGQAAPGLGRGAAEAAQEAIRGGGDRAGGAAGAVEDILD